MTPKQEYVVGFNFIRRCEANAPWEVVLIQKKRPDWQRGKLNGIGGHIEPGESPLMAMQREYREETADSVDPVWTFFLTQEFDDCIVHFFKAQNAWTHARTVTDETVYVVPVRTIVDGDYTTIPNLRWLIPMALLSDDGGVLHYKACPV